MYIGGKFGDYLPKRGKYDNNLPNLGKTWEVLRTAGLENVKISSTEQMLITKTTC